MAQLLNLPNELLSVIAQSLSAADTVSHQAALASLCLACWRLNRVARDELYIEPRLFLLCNSDPLRQWCNFARTAQQAPELASKVRRLALDATAFVDKGEITAFWVDLSRLGIRDPRSVSIGPVVYAARLAQLLITLAGNATKLQLHLTTQAHQAILKIFDIDSESWPKGLRLKEIEIYPIGGQLASHATLTRQRSRVLLSPALRKLHLEQFAFINQTRFLDPPIQTHKLVELHLHKCFIPYQVLKSWVNACVQLKAFSFSALDNNGGPELCRIFQMFTVRQLTSSELLLALQSCTNTLERLDADFTDARDSDIANPLDQPSMSQDPSEDYIYPGFENFFQLRHLRIEFAHIDETVKLPSTLVSLTLITKNILEVSDRSINFLCLEFMDLVHGQCPHLKWINVEEEELGEADIHSALTKLQWLDEARSQKGIVQFSFEFRLFAKGDAPRNI